MIAADHMQEIVDRLVAALQPEKIILFGSHARGEADPHSDVDLLIVADSELSSLERAVAARRSLHGFPVAFDIIWETPDEYRRTRSVVNEIAYFADKYGKVVYER